MMIKVYGATNKDRTLSFQHSKGMLGQRSRRRKQASIAIALSAFKVNVGRQEGRLWTKVEHPAQLFFSKSSSESSGSQVTKGHFYSLCEVLGVFANNCLLYFPVPDEYLVMRLTLLNHHVHIVHLV